MKISIYTKIFILVFAWQITSYSQPQNLSNKQLEKLLVDAGNSFYDLDYRGSLINCKKVLNHSLKKNNHRLTAKAYNLIGLNFAEFLDTKTTIYYYNKSLYYANLDNNDTIRDWVYNNLGNIYTEEKIDFNKGIEFYKKGLNYSIIRKDSTEIVYTKLNIATSYFELKKFKEGRQYLDPIKKYILEKGDLESKMIINSLFGAYYDNLNKINLSIDSYLKAIEIGKKINNELINTELTTSYEALSTLYIKKQDYKQALYYLSIRNELNDRINDKERLKKAKLISSQIEIENYKRQLVEIENTNKTNVENLNASKKIVILFCVIFVILLALLYFVYKNFKIRKTINIQLQDVNNELLKAKDDAERAFQVKSQFVSTITHELRTPLYGVVGITNMIVDEHKELANSPYLNSLKYSAKYLLSLVNDVLQINKIEENKIVLEEMAFNVSDEIHSIVNSLQFIAEKNKNKLRCEIDSNIPEYLIGDKLRLSQIFMNLISNALKFTKKGIVLVTANLVKVEGNLNFIQFQIKDTGVGIAKEDQDRVFEKFIQVGRKKQDYQGTGLGLSIVKKLIELFGSEIKLESEEGQGTTFTFTIGFEEDNVKLHKFIGDFDVDLSDSLIYKILVVEDNAINQLITKKILDNNRFNSKIVNDGLDAIKLLKKENFDVILMDINMPIINGFETSIKIRELGINTPIIALTAFEKEEVIEEVISSGMNDIIVKPFDPTKLFKIINRQIQKERLNEKN